MDKVKRFSEVRVGDYVTVKSIQGCPCCEPTEYDVLCRVYNVDPDGTCIDAKVVVEHSHYNGSRESIYLDNVEDDNKYNTLERNYYYESYEKGLEKIGGRVIVP